jgi:hypothetical protein
MVMPVTVTGVERLVVVPSPSCPRLLAPQAATVRAGTDREAVGGAGGDPVDVGQSGAGVHRRGSEWTTTPSDPTEVRVTTSGDQMLWSPARGEGKMGGGPILGPPATWSPGLNLEGTPCASAQEPP